MKKMRSDQVYTGICTFVSAIWAAILLTQIVAPVVGPANFACGISGLVAGSLLGFFVPRRTLRSWPVLGLAIGALVGYILPTANVEHHNHFREFRDFGLNVIHLAVGGAMVGLIVDVILKPPQWSGKWQFSLSTLLWFVTVFAFLCGSVKMYLQIVSLRQ